MYCMIEEMSILNAFTTQMVQFLDELGDTFPEEKDIKMATESVKGAKKINPRLLLNLFVEYVYKPCSKAIYEKNIHDLDLDIIDTEMKKANLKYDEFKKNKFTQNDVNNIIKNIYTKKKDNTYNICKSTGY